MIKILMPKYFNVWCSAMQWKNCNHIYTLIYCRMSCRGFLTRSSSLKRVNSDLENKTTYAEDDGQSYLISGNLNNIPGEICDSDDEDDYEDEFEDCMEEILDDEAVGLREVERLTKCC